MTIKDIFNDKNNAMEFWNTFTYIHQYLSLLSNVRLILTFFGSFVKMNTEIA